uniref:Uncharacterized protein n=1 Tax=Moniliophthora roreri TaxID=221103 RepID=A0A0W0FN59_MONRR
MCGGLLTNPP